MKLRVEVSPCPLPCLNSLHHEFFPKYFFKRLFLRFNTPYFQLAVPTGHNFEKYKFFINMGETHMLDQSSMTAVKTFSRPDECRENPQGFPLLRIQLDNFRISVFLGFFSGGTVRYLP